MLAAGATGLVARVPDRQRALVAAALLLQLKTVLDNADGQLARLTGRVTALGRYLDSESDLARRRGALRGDRLGDRRWVLAAAGFACLTAVLGVNYNAERLYRARGEPAERCRATGLAACSPASTPCVYAPQDRLVERFVERRLRGAARSAAGVPRPGHRRACWPTSA